MRVLNQCARFLCVFALGPIAMLIAARPAYSVKHSWPTSAVDCVEGTIDGIDAIQRAYSLSFELHYGATSGSNPGSDDERLNLGQVWARRLANGDPHALSLLNLGYSLQRDPAGLQILIPPTEYRVLFLNHRKRLRQAIESGQVTRDQTIKPVLVYFRVGGRPNSENWADYRFVDPIDEPPMTGNAFVPIASIGDLLDQKDLPESIWIRTMADGRMPFPIGGYLDHEAAGHLAEFGDDPHLMRVTRAFFERLQQTLASGGRRGPHLQRRVFALAEFFSVPRLSMTQSVAELFPTLGSTTASPSEVRQFYQAHLVSLPVDRLQVIIAELGQRQFQYFIPMGGASRDGYSLEQRITGLERDHAPQGELPVVYANETFFAIIAELAALNTQYESPPTDLSRPRRRTPGVQSLSDPDALRAVARARMVDLLAELACAFYWANRLNVTPARLFEEGTQDYLDRNSATYRYLDAYLPQNSELRRIFLR